MGAYFLVVNPVRRQYLDPSRFGEAVKISSVLRGDHCIGSLKLLIADCYGRDTTSFRGAWLGDPVILAGDDSGFPCPGGLMTASPDDAGRNLHAMARSEFTDISYRALAELCRDGATAAELAGRSKEDESLLIDLGATLEQYPLASLEAALNAAVGKPWRRAYSQARAKLPWWNTLPPIDWAL
ncbi:hypothetical protein EP7_001309 [Isosphaeraceae bacterium EP7]